MGFICLRFVFFLKYCKPFSLRSSTPNFPPYNKEPKEPSSPVETSGPPRDGRSREASSQPTRTVLTAYSHGILLPLGIWKRAVPVQTKAFPMLFFHSKLTKD